MDIFVDHEPYSPTDPAPATIDELLSQLKPQLANRNRIVVSISCDQKLLAEDEITQALTQDLAGLQRLDLTTAAVHELALEALEAARSILGETRAKQDETIELLSKDQNDAAIGALGECLAGWTQAHDTVVKTISLLGLNIDELAHEGKKVLDTLNEVTHHLTQLKECLGAGDFVLLNDLLQYEIAPWFDQWEGLIDSILSEVRASVPT